MKLCTLYGFWLKSDISDGYDTRKPPYVVCVLHEPKILGPKLAENDETRLISSTHLIFSTHSPASFVCCEIIKRKKRMYKMCCHV
jgi:hypothetical protein